MSKNIDRGAVDQTISLLSSEAQKLLVEAFNNLRSTTTLKEHVEPPRLFFPNGIELIYVKLEAGLSEKTKVVVELKIAGEKGIKGSSFEAESEGADEPTARKTGTA